MELKSKIRIRFILFRALVILLTVAVAGLAAGLIGYILKKGLPYVSWEFLTTEPDILMDLHGSSYSALLYSAGNRFSYLSGGVCQTGKNCFCHSFCHRNPGGNPIHCIWFVWTGFFCAKNVHRRLRRFYVSRFADLDPYRSSYYDPDHRRIAASCEFFLPGGSGSHGSVKILHHPQSDPALCHLRNRSGHYSQYRTNDQRIRSPFVHGGYCAGPANLGSVPCEGAGSHYDGTVVSVCHRRRGTGMGAVRHGSRVDAVCLVY